VFTVQSEESEKNRIQTILGRFPTSEIAARGIDDSKGKNPFTTYTSEGRTNFVLPKNYEDHGKNVFFISMVAVAVKLGYYLVLGETSVPAAVLNTDEGHFFAGYVNQALASVTGARKTGASKFSKGEQAFQLYCVDTHYKNTRHLRHGGHEKLSRRLSSLKGFTKEWWSTRNHIITLFKALPAKPVTELETFVVSQEELRKLMKTSYSWDNRGIFREEEIAYLKSRYSSMVAEYENFVASTKVPSEALCRSFDALYETAVNPIRRCEQEISAAINLRSQFLFLNSKKKKDIEWNKTKLLDKIEKISDESKFSRFMPDSLPGIRRIKALPNIMEAVPQNQITQYWGFPDDNQDAANVCESWNNFVNLLPEDDE
jgi:hypothetical protein